MAEMNKLRNDMGGKELAIIGFLVAVVGMGGARPYHISMGMQTEHQTNKIRLARAALATHISPPQIRNASKHTEGSTKAHNHMSGLTLSWYTGSIAGFI